MPPFITAFIAFEQAHIAAQVAWLIGVLPSLIVALTNFPKAAGAIATILKFLNVFSVLTHKDSPNTLKLPFTQSKPPATGEQKLAAAPSAPVAIGKITLAFIAVALSAGAHAQTVSSGPSLAFFEVRPGYAHPVQVAAGAGYQVSLGFFQTNAIFGEEADLLDVGGSVYGSAVSAPSGTTAGNLGAALFVGTLNEVIGVGVGEDILSSNGGLFSLPPYLTVMLNLQRFVFGQPPTVPGAPGVVAARRWLTSYL